MKKINDISIDNNYDNPNPIYKPEKSKIILTTNPKQNLYQQVGYQLSHEIIHHILYFDNNVTSWNEKVSKAHETLCSAFALFFVKSMNWVKYFDEELESLNEEKRLYSKWKDEIIKILNELLNGKSLLILINEASDKWKNERQK